MEQAAPNISRADKEYPKGLKLFLLTVAICLTIFLISLEYGTLSHLSRAPATLRSAPVMTDTDVG